MLNKIDPSMESWWVKEYFTPSTIGIINFSFLLSLWKVFVNKIKDRKSKTISIKFSNYLFPWIAVESLWEIGIKNVRFSENLECFVFLKHLFWDSPFWLTSVPWTFPLLTAHFNFSNIARRKFCALCPFLKPHWNFNNNWPINKVICSDILKNILEVIHRILTSCLWSLCIPC